MFHSVIHSESVPKFSHTSWSNWRRRLGTAGTNQVPRSEFAATTSLRTPSTTSTKTRSICIRISEFSSSTNMIRSRMASMVAACLRSLWPRFASRYLTSSLAFLVRLPKELYTRMCCQRLLRHRTTFSCLSFLGWLSASPCMRAIYLMLISQGSSWTKWLTNKIRLMIYFRLMLSFTKTC